jgi:hypothetical protein
MGAALTRADRPQAATAVAQMTAWQPDWSKIKVNKPTPAERATGARVTTARRRPPPRARASRT